MSTQVAHSKSINTLTQGPELLAPAGNWECLRAAVENGADAIYFGLSGFNARMRADNFTLEDLPEVMRHLHARKVRGYLTMNTLVFADEVEAAMEQIKAAIRADVDAVIVQDVGLCRMIRALSPDFPIHASTQMTITSHAGIQFARHLGCQLVVMARECSIKELESIQQTQASLPESTDGSMPLEVFVHGALCVAYSGQCLTSEALGGRSANRGECAQACRMPYELIQDGKSLPLGDQQYLLSPQDLAGLPVVPEIIKLGIHSLKIEGRLKHPEYVANVTRVYRDAIDRTLSDRGASKDLGKDLYRSSKYPLEMAFSRGLYTGWFQGIDNQELVHARFGKKRGVFLGRIKERHRDGFTLETDQPIKAGDGIVVDQGKPNQPEQGGRVFRIAQPGKPSRSGKSGPSSVKEVRLVFQSKQFDWSRIRDGDRIWKTSDPALDRELRQSYQQDTREARLPISVHAQGSPGEPLRIEAHHPGGATVTVCSEMPLQEAINRPIDQALLRKQFGRLGDSAYILDQLTFHNDQPAMIPVSELNRMRREMVAQLDRIQVEPAPRWTLHEEPVKAPHFADQSVQTVGAEPKLIPLVRNMDQLQAALDFGCPQIYCDFEHPKQYREAVAAHRSVFTNGSEVADGSGLWVAPPRITKPEEDWILRQVRSSEPDGFLIRNYDHLEYFAEDRCIADFSFNMANAWTAGYFLEQFHLERITASYDLNVEQLQAFLASVPTSRTEITLHQHMPMFHMEHCVFCAFMSTGKDYRDCGRPCEKHQVQLKDRTGQLHPLKADAGCRNTVYNGRAQTGAEYAMEMLDAGVRHFRVEFIDESAKEVRDTLQAYRDLLDGKRDGASVWQDLKLINQLGVTRGTLETSGRMHG